MTALFLAVSAMPVAAAEELPPGEEFSAEASRTKCSLGSTVCVTPAAVATVSCSFIAARTPQCTGVATHSGHGVSPPPYNLAGDVTFSGSGSTSGDCSGSGSATGGASWTSGGKGDQATKTHCTKFKVFVWPFTGCVKLTTSASTSATARSKTLLNLVVESVTESVSETKTGQLCVT